MKIYNYRLRIVNLIHAYHTKMKRKRGKNYLLSLPSQDSYCHEIWGLENKIALNGKRDESLDSIKPFKLSKTIIRKAIEAS